MVGFTILQPITQDSTSWSRSVLFSIICWMCGWGQPSKLYTGEGKQQASLASHTNSNKLKSVATFSSHNQIFWQKLDVYRKGLDLHHLSWEQVTRIRITGTPPGVYQHLRCLE